jgi:hypothetical protein
MQEKNILNFAPNARDFPDCAAQAALRVVLRSTPPPDLHTSRFTAGEAAIAPLAAPKKAKVGLHWH